MDLILAAVTAAVVWAAPTAHAASTIDVRVSVKIIRNPATGARPAMANGSLLTDAYLDTMFTSANTELLARYGRGYRFVLMEVVEVGSVCGSCTIPNPSFWFNTAFGDSMDVFEDSAKVYSAYAWRTNALNVYVNWGQGDGGVSSFPSPPDAEELTVVGSRCFANSTFDPRFAAGVFTHELGHYFDLGHTNGVACGVNCVIDTICTTTDPTDGDGIYDTIPDSQCASKNDLAQFHFAISYASLNAAEKDTVDVVYDNLMAYLHHDTQAYGYFLSRLTEMQLDRWTETANDVRMGVRSGRTWFVSTGGATSGANTSTRPWSFTSAMNAAGEGTDALLLEGGNYSGSLVLTKALTFRARRTGGVFLGP